MTAPSELAELILEWAEKRKPETFTTAQVYQDLNFIDTHKEVSDSLRYMFKKGIIVRKKKDSRSFEYALADVAPDDFEMYEFRPVAFTTESNEQEKYTSVWAEEAVEAAIQNGAEWVKENSLFINQSNKDQMFVTSTISPNYSWDTGEEIKESSPLDIEHFNTVYDDVKGMTNEDYNDILDLMSEAPTVHFSNTYKGYDGISNSGLKPGDVTWADLDSALWKNEKLHEQADSIDDSKVNIDIQRIDITPLSYRNAEPIDYQTLRELSDQKEQNESADSIQIGGDHYKRLVVQPWSAMESWMTKDQFTGFLRGNAIKYLARCEIKGGIEDLKKARHYLDKLIEVSEGG